jgi:predicted Zn finger-like uncharacterized protein
MRITCPHCTAAYEVPTATLSSGRKVRCARCGAEWRVLREPLPPSNLGLAASAPDPDRSGEGGAKVATAGSEGHPERFAWLSGGRLPALRAAWIASGVVLLLIVASVVTWRQDIIKAWPAGARILAPFEQTAYPPVRKAESGPK